METIQDLLATIDRFASMLNDYSYEAALLGVSLMSGVGLIYLIMWVSGIAKDGCSSPECA